MIQKLPKFIISSFFKPFILTFCISLFVLLMQFLWVYIDDIIGKGLAWYTITELLIYTSCNLIPMALPLSALFASIMTFGDIAEHYELVALKSSGISLFKIFKPLLIFISSITICAFIFDNYIIPKANLRYYTLLFDIRSQKPGIDIKPDIFYNKIDNIVIRIKEKEIREEGDLLKDIMIYNHINAFGNKKLMMADSGTFKLSKDKSYIIFKLYNGIDYQEKEGDDATNNLVFSKTEFKEYEFLINLKGFNLKRSKENSFSQDFRMLNMLEIYQSVDSLKKEKTTLMNNLIGQIKNHYLVDSNIYKASQGSFKYHSFKDYTDTIPTKEKLTIYTHSINNVRNIQNKINFNKTYFESGEERIRRFNVNFHKKITTSLAIIAMLLIGVPLGAIVKKGGLGMPIVISVICFLIFWSLVIVCEKTAIKGAIHPFFGAWLPLIIIIPIGIGILYYASKK